MNYAKRKKSWRICVRNSDSNSNSYALYANNVPNFLIMIISTLMNHKYIRKKMNIYNNNTSIHDGFNDDDDDDGDDTRRKFLVVNRIN